MSHQVFGQLILCLRVKIFTVVIIKITVFRDVMQFNTNPDIVPAPKMPMTVHEQIPHYTESLFMVTLHILLWAR